MSPQMDIQSYSMGLVNLFEVLLPSEQTPIQDDRISGELAQPKKTDVELEAMRKYLGWPPKEKRQR
jgi:hypothetical protein